MNMEGTRTEDRAYRPRPRVPRFVFVLGAIVVLLGLVAVGVGFGVERWANKKKDEAAQQLSAQMGRPVSVGKVRLALLRGQVEIKDIVVGRDPAVPDEPDPAFRLDRAFVNVSVGSAITSLGKRVVVNEIAVERPLIQVARDKEGRLNWQRIAERLDKGEDKPPEPMDQATRDRVTGLVVRHLHLDDAKVRFVDLARPGAAAEISDVDFVIRELSLARAWEAQLSAAVLASRKNFDFRAHFGPAAGGKSDEPPAPLLEKLTAKLEPVPLAPLAPFAAAVMGAGLEELAEGKMSMDFTVVPGAAAPGGRGATTVVGNVTLAGIQFAGGERFDARLNTDVGGDVAQGTVDIKDISAKLGEMAIKAQGRIADLQGAPRAERFSVESVGLDFTRLHAYYPPLDRTAGAELRGPFALFAKGEGSAQEQRLSAMFDMTPASVVVPGQLRKPPGTPLVLELRAEATPELMKVEKLTLTFAKLVLQAAASVRTQGTGKAARRTFEATLDAPVFAVREVGALLAPKAVADLPEIRVGLNARASGTVGRPETIKAEIPSLKLLSGKSDLHGRLTVENLRKPRLAFEGQSKYLDVDDFVPATKKTGARTTEKKTDKKTAGGARPAAEEPLPPMVRDMEGTVKLAVDRGRAADIDYSNLRTDVTLKQGRLVARTLEVGALGGRFSGGGSEMPLLGDKDSFIARGEVQGVDVAAVIAHLTGGAGSGLLTGRLSGKLDVNGGGTEPKTILDTLTGLLSGRVAEAQFLPSSLLGPVIEALENAARAAPPLAQALKGIESRASLLKDRRIGDLAGALRFASGAAEITNPLKAQTPSGPLTVSGKVGFDGEADLTAELALAPEIASALVAGRAKFDAPIPVQLKLEGPLRKPRIRPAQPAQIVRVFVTALAKSQVGEAARARVDAATGQATEKAREEAARASEAAEATKKAAEERAREEAQKAREAAGRRLRGILGK